MGDDQQQHIRATFDSVADTYDEVGVDLFQPVAERLVAELAPTPGERALDVGCGKGAVLLRLAERVGPAGSAVGIDLSPRMVGHARERAARQGLAVDVREADALAPGLPSSSFDLVASSLVLFFLPDAAAALRAWRDLLVDGGRLGVSTFGPYSESWQAVDDVFAAHRPPAMRDPRTTAADSPFASDAGMEALVSGSGFTDVRTVTAEVQVRFEDPQHWEAWSMSVGQRRMWESVPEELLPAVRSEAHDRLEATRGADGRIGFDQVVRFTLGRR